MKKLLIPLFGLFLAFGLFSFLDGGIVSAQTVTEGTIPNSMIRTDDNVNAVKGATSFGGSFRQGALTVVNFILLFLGLIATIMVIYGGFLYITSAGGDGTEKAKKILLYAAIGIVIVLISFAVVNTLLGAGDLAGNSDA